MTLDDIRKAEIAAYIKGRYISKGLGTREEPCSIEANKLALTGELTDKIPDCMSKVIGAWVIRIQDCMPDDMRNGEQWRSLLPLAAGTGREFENERLHVIMSWLRGIVLPTLDAFLLNGAGDLANAAARSAAAAARSAAAAAAEAAVAAVEAAQSAVWAVAAAAEAAVAAVEAAQSAVWAVAAAATWAKLNPPALLQQLIEVEK
jgi:hypothetical protein